MQIWGIIDQDNNVLYGNDDRAAVESEYERRVAEDPRLRRVLEIAELELAFPGRGEPVEEGEPQTICVLPWLPLDEPLSFGAVRVDHWSAVREAVEEPACATADALGDLFWDAVRGGMFTTGQDAEQLVTRNKDLMDNATPSANSLAAVAFQRLAALTGDDRYRHHAEQILRLAGPLATRHPTAFGHLLVAVDQATAGLDEVVVAGDRPDLVGLVQRTYLPRAVLAWG